MYYTVWHTEEGLLQVSDPTDKQTAIHNRDFLRSKDIVAWVEDSEHNKIEGE